MWMLLEGREPRARGAANRAVLSQRETALTMPSRKSQAEKFVGRLRLLFTALLLAACVSLGFTTSRASATDTAYCGTLVASGQTWGSGTYYPYVMNLSSFGLSVSQVCSGLLTAAGNWKARTASYPNGCAVNTDSYAACFANPTPTSQGVAWGFWSNTAAYHTLSGYVETGDIAYWCAGT
jgi:hypothetical protein